MKKITASARVIDIFSTEPLEVCAMLLELAQQILKSRQTRNSQARNNTKQARRTPAPETPEPDGKEGA